MRSPTLVVAGVLVATGAQAAEPARLRYERGAGAQGCPAEGEVRGAVAALLGSDPFRDDAARTIDAQIARRSGAFVARIVVVTEGGEPAERELRDRSPACAAIAEALELAIAIAIDPLAGTTPAPAPAPEPAPVPAAPEPPPAVAAPALQSPPARPALAATVRTEPDEGFSLAVHVAAGAVLGAGALPDPMPGVTLQAGLALGRASLSVEGRLDLPGSAEVAPGGRADVSLLFGALVPCFELRPLAACALLGAGSLRSEGVGLATNERATSTFFAAGGRVAAEAAMGGPFALQAHLDLLVPFSHTRVIVGEAPVWETPAVSGAAGIAAVGRFR